MSPEDTKVTVFQSVDAAKKFRIKGKEFMIVGALRRSHPRRKIRSQPEHRNLPINASGRVGQDRVQDVFTRNSHSDYHSPFCATLGKRSSIHGTSYTVNP
ncbi:hypothetical protein FRB94_014264 [Tulasnella sp. JGI-2019a]|nr:hypothetical protein FRB93_005384 [Tulasnella sp. JGI-2019a]KAG9014171.1 hypothetical protein FRB94_014264 [Tulasnella sp. JGI-2019a]KAG9029679.1 hypothetical protein FRB95_005020 [Tulasnella sp. JGI-2019a]